MTFQLIGTTITQMGIDHELTGLEALDRVTTITAGSGANRYKIYKIAGSILNVTGELTIGEREELIFDEDVPIRALTVPASGTLVLGSETMVNGAVLRPDWCPITFTKVPAGSLDNANDFQVEGAYTHFGGTIRMVGTIKFEPGSTVRLVSGKIIGTHTGSSRIRQRSGALTIELDFTTQQSIRPDFYQPPVLATGFQSAYTSLGGFQVLSGQVGGSNEPFTFGNYNAQGLAYVADAFRGARLQFLNLELPGELLITHNQVTTADPYRPVTIVEKQFRLNIRDAGGNPVEGARYFIRDTDHGDRPNTSAVWSGGVSEDFQSDRTYSGSSNADGNALNSEFGLEHKILTRTIREGHSQAGVYGRSHSNGTWLGSATSILDYRGNEDTFSDLFNVHVWSYNHQYRLLSNIPMRGRGILALVAELLTDSSITEPDRDVVSGYSGIFINYTTRLITIDDPHNLDEIMDYTKYHKTIQANIERPAIGTLLASQDGQILDISNFNMQINSTVTAGTKFNTLRTTGTITIGETGSANIGILDSNGVRFTISTNISPTNARVSITQGGTTTNMDLVIDGQEQITVPVGAVISITAKPEAYTAIVRRAFDTASTLTASLQFIQDFSLELGQSINGFTEDQLRFNFVEGGVSQFVFGEINTRGQLETAKRLFDSRMSKPDGIRFLHEYNDGRPQHDELTDANMEPTGITYANGLYYVVNFNDRRVYAYNEAFRNVSGRNFTLGSQVTSPSGITFDNDTFYITDSDGVIYIYDEFGLMTTSIININTITHARSSVLRTTSDRIYVLDDRPSLPKRIVAVGFNGVLHVAENFDLDSANTTPTGMVIIGSNIHVLNSSDRKTYAYSFAGVRQPAADITLNAPGLFTGITTTPDHVIVVAEGQGNEPNNLFAFSYTGVRDENPAPDLDDFLDGNPYRILSDQVQINEDYIEFVRKAGFTIRNISIFGAATYIKNQTTFYIPNVSNGGRVDIDTQTMLINLPRSVGREIITDLIQDPTLINDISDNVADSVDQRLTPKLTAIEDDVEELDSKFGNSIIPTFVAANSVAGPENGTSTGTAEAVLEHGPVELNNTSAVYALYAILDLLPENSATLHIDLNDAELDSSFGTLDYEVLIYGLVDMDLLDFLEADLADPQKYNAFKTANEDRKIFEATNLVPANTVPFPASGTAEGRMNLPIPSNLNRVAVILRNNQQFINTVQVDFKELKISVRNALGEVIEDTNILERFRFTGEGDASKVNATGSGGGGSTDLTDTNAKIDAVKEDTELLITRATEIKSDTETTRTTATNIEEDTTSIESLIDEIHDFLEKTLDISVESVTGQINENEADNAITGGVTAFGGHGSQTDYIVYDMGDTVERAEINFDVLSSFNTFFPTQAQTLTLRIFADLDLDSIASNNYDYINNNNDKLVFQEAFNGAVPENTQSKTFNINSRFNRLVFVTTLEGGGSRAILRFRNLQGKYEIVKNIDTNIVDKLDVSVSSRLEDSSYVAPDNTALATLNSKLSDTRAANLDRLDATIGSRLAGSAYVVPENAKITALDTRLTAARAANLDNLDATISSRLATSAYTQTDTTALATAIGTVNTSITTLLNRITAARAAKLDNLGASTLDIENTLNGAITSLNTLLGRLTGQRATNLDNLDQSISTLVAMIEAGLLDDADGEAFLNAVRTQVGEKLSEENLSASIIATTIWNTVLTSLTTDGTIGKLIRDNLNETISSIVPSIRAVLTSDSETALLDDIRDDASLIRKIISNNYAIDHANNTFVIYDDDGSTVLSTYDLQVDTENRDSGRVKQ